MFSQALVDDKISHGNIFRDKDILDAGSYYDIASGLSSFDVLRGGGDGDSVCAGPAGPGGHRPPDDVDGSVHNQLLVSTHVSVRLRD